MGGRFEILLSFPKMAGLQGHPTTVFWETFVRSSLEWLKFSRAQELPLIIGDQRPALKKVSYVARCGSSLSDPM